MDSELGQREKRQCLEAERKLLQFTMQMFIYIKRELPGSKVHSVKLPSEKTAHRKKKKINPKKFFPVLKLEANSQSLHLNRNGKVTVYD